MEKTCKGCGEPWDLYGIIHDEGGLEAIENAPTSAIITSAIEFNGFELEGLCGLDEIPEGHFLFNRCPCCPKPGQEVERPKDNDLMPLGEALTNSALTDEERWQVLQKIIA
jgi:hypothetical protein